MRGSARAARSETTELPEKVKGFGVWGLGFGVWGLGFGGLGFGVWITCCRALRCKVQRRVAFLLVDLIRVSGSGSQELRVRVSNVGTF